MNILFICVLPSQLQDVIDDIKPNLPDTCIVYSFVRSEYPLHLKNLLGELNFKTNIIKPNYTVNMKLNHTDSNWNYMANISESLASQETIEMTNPFISNESINLKIMNE